MAAPVWNSAWQAYDDGLGHMWRNDQEGWVQAPAAAPTPSYTPPAARPTVGGFAQEVPSTMGTRTANGGRAGVTGGGTGAGTGAGTGTSTAPSAAAPILTNSPTTPGLGPRTVEEWMGQHYTSAMWAILLGTANPADYPGVPAQFFGIKDPNSPNFNANFQIQTGMLDGYLNPILAQQYAASGLNLPSVPQQDSTVINANTQQAIAQGNNTTSTNNTNATIAGNKEIEDKRAASALAVQNAANAGALAVANVKAGTDNADIQARKDIAAGDRTSRETIAANALAESQRQFNVSTAEGARQFNATTLVSLLDKGIQLAQKPVDWIGYQFFMNNMGVPMNALTMNSAVQTFGAVPPTGPSGAGPVVGGPGVVYGDTSHAEALGVTPQFVPVTQAVAQNPGGQGDPSLAQHSAAALLPQWQQQAGGANQLEATLAQARQQEVAPQLKADTPAGAQLIQQIQSPAVQPLSSPALPASPGGSGMASSPTGYTGAQAPSSWTPAAAAQAPAPFGQPFDQGTKQSPLAAPQVPGAVTNSLGTPMVANQQNLTPEQWAATQARGNELAVMAPPTPLGQPNTTMPEQPTSFTPPGPLTGPSMGQVPDSAPGQMVSTGGNTGGATGIYTGPPASSTVTGGTSTPASTSGAQTPQGSDLLQHLSTQLGIPYDQLAQLVPPSLMAGGYSPQQIAQTPVIQGLQNPDGAGFGGVYRTAPVGDSKFGTIQAFGIPLGVRGGQDINAQSFMNTTAANRDMIQGAIEATGQSWPDVQQQMLRSSPVSNYNGGAFGKRIY